MKADVYLRFVAIEKRLGRIFKLLEKIMVSQTQHAADLDAMAAQVAKVRTEVEALIEAVKAAGNTTPEVDAAMAATQAALTGVDDLNPDAVPPQPTP